MADNASTESLTPGQTAGSFLGSGMSARAYGLVLLSSVLLFVGWDGGLWRVSDGHAIRFAVSYLGVVPLAAAVLAVQRNFSGARLATAVGTLWAIKLVVTALLYTALAPGGALTEMGSVAPARPSVAHTTHPPSTAEAYQPAANLAESGTLRGLVTVNGAPVAGVVVFIEHPAPGLPLPSKSATRIALGTVGASGDAHAAHLAFVGQAIDLQNNGAQAHTARVQGGGTTLLNTPVPAGATVQVPELEAAGEFVLSCAMHPTERLSLVIIDHPYGTITGPDGAFELTGVPTGNTSVVAVAGPGGSLRATKRATVAAAETTTMTMTITFNEDQTEP